MTRGEIRAIVLETLIEAGILEGTYKTHALAEAASGLLEGKGRDYRKESHRYASPGYASLAERYPHLVQPDTSSEVEWAALIKDKPPPICIWHEGDARAYYNASEKARNAWNAYAQREADAASEDLDMGEALSAYTSVDRDGKLQSWAPPQWFPEWLEKHPEYK